MTEMEQCIVQVYYEYIKHQVKERILFLHSMEDIEDLMKSCLLTVVGKTRFHLLPLARFCQLPLASPVSIFLHL